MKTEPLLQFFAFAHLPPHLQGVSKPFHDVAVAINACPQWDVEPEIAEQVAALMVTCNMALPANLERDQCAKKLRAVVSFAKGRATPAGGLSKGGALRYLLEAKDCAVRAMLYREPV